jgi:hypothetical protein
VKNIRVLLCPSDLRKKNFSPPMESPAWTAQVYQDLRTALAEYPVPDGQE